jgi:hypothetical protein
LIEYVLIILIPIALYGISAFVAHKLSANLARLVTRRAIIVRILAWTVLLPICLVLSAGTLGLIIWGYQGFFLFSYGFAEMLFSPSMVDFNFFAALGIWIVGTILIYRKETRLQETMKPKPKSQEFDK